MRKKYKNFNLFRPNLLVFLFAPPEDVQPLEGGKSKKKEQHEDIDAQIEGMTLQEKKDVLIEPIKLKALLEKDREQKRMINPEDTVGKMLSATNQDTDFLKEVIKVYGEKDDVFLEYGNVGSQAVEMINGVDEKFFKEIFKKCSDEYMRTAALRRIKDQKYLREVAEKYRKQKNHNEGRAAMEGITDQNYLREIALDESADHGMREAALANSTDVKLLKTFANKPDVSDATPNYEEINYWIGLRRIEADRRLRQMAKIQTMLFTSLPGI